MHAPLNAKYFLACSVSPTYKDFLFKKHQFNVTKLTLCQLHLFLRTIYSTGRLINYAFHLFTGFLQMAWPLHNCNFMELNDQ